MVVARRVARIRVGDVLKKEQEKRDNEESWPMTTMRDEKRPMKKTIRSKESLKNNTLKDPKKGRAVSQNGREPMGSELFDGDNTHATKTSSRRQRMGRAPRVKWKI